MKEPDKTNSVLNNRKNKVLNDKRKLLEVYALVSGLIITSIQTTSSLIAINTSVNETAYKDTILATKAIIESSNIAFFLFIFLLLVYYTKTFDDDMLFTTLLVALISIFFSYILTNFIDLYTHLSMIGYIGLLVATLIAILLTLVQNSILMAEFENKVSKLINNIYGLAPKTFKTTSSKHILLKIWSSIILVVIFYSIYNIFMVILLLKNPQLYYTLISSQTEMIVILWITSLIVSFKIFTVLLSL